MGELSSNRLKGLKAVLSSDESSSDHCRTTKTTASSRSEVFITETVKQPSKVMASGMMNFRCLSNLHIVPRGKTVRSDFHAEEVRKGTAASAMRRRTENGPPTAIKLLPSMSAIFQQDGA